MALYVYKFGGTSVGTVERIKAVAEKVKKARDLGDWILQKNLQCANCLLDIADLALQENDIARARMALSKASGLEQEIFANRYFHEKYLGLTERLRKRDINDAPADAKAPARNAADPD